MSSPRATGRSRVLAVSFVICLPFRAARTALSRLAGLAVALAAWQAFLAREISPVIVSIHSAAICARC